MASVTLAESAKLCQNTLVAGVIETVVTVDNFYDLLPFDEIEGNALAYNRENALGDVQWGTIDTTITAKAAATFTQVTTTLTSLLGDAEVNGLIQATRSNVNDQKAIQIASKAKNVGRTYANNLVNGDGTSNVITGLLSLVAVGQTVTAGANGAALTLDMLDELMDKVVDKGGIVDYLMMHSRTLRKYYALLRALGGASIGDVVTLPSGRQVPGYRGTPIFRNDFIPITQTQGSEDAASTVLAGTIDDGSRSMGIAGLTATGAAGIRVEDVGTSETKDNTITRVKFYCGLANFSQLGLAALIGVNGS